MRVPKLIYMTVLWVFGACVPSALEGPWGPAPGVSHFDTWEDPARYESRTVEVTGIDLHYLDWGGTGDAMLFLAGGGQTAYVMGGLADRFTETHRVLALTRRGSGESESPEAGYQIDDHASDIIGFLTALGVEQVTLVGHSMAGAEMSRVAELEPELAQRLVYLDATYDYAGYSEMTSANPHPRPSPRDFGWPTSASLRDYNRVHVYGFWSDSLEADLRVSFWRPTSPQLTSTFIADAQRRPNNYSAIRAPALAFWAVPTFSNYAPGQAAAADPEVRRAMEDYFAAVRLPWGQSGAERFLADIPDGRLVRVDANHHFFIPLEDLVVREIQAFLDEYPGAS